MGNIKVYGHLNIELVDTVVADDDEAPIRNPHKSDEAHEARKRFEEFRHAVMDDNCGPVSGKIHDAINNLIDAIQAVDEGATVFVGDYSVGFDKPEA